MERDGYGPVLALAAHCHSWLAAAGDTRGNPGTALENLLGEHCERHPRIPRFSLLCLRARDPRRGHRRGHFNGIGFVEIRGITDAADKKVPEDFARNLPVAMGNVLQ